MMWGLLRGAFPERFIAGSAIGLVQEIAISRSVVNRISKHRQKSPAALEAGGQLFGLVAPNRVDVMCATGPFANDDRARCHYRSSPASAQRSVVVQSRRGLLYLGEWHTHAEDTPSPSRADTVAMETLRQRSRLNTSAVLLLIVGRIEPPAGWSLMSFGRCGLVNWSLQKRRLDQSGP